MYGMLLTVQSRSHVNTRNAWIFFGITVLEAIANCGLEGVLFYFVASTIDIRANPTARTIPTYLAIYILALYPAYSSIFVNFSLFQVVFTFLAIRQRNTIQIIGLVIFNAAFVAYSAVQVFPPIFLLLNVFTRLLKFPVKLKTKLTKTSPKK
jgi:hypothetical protein